MSDTKAEASYYEPCVEVICLCGNDFVYNTHYRDYGECDKCNRRYAYTGALKEITRDTKASDNHIEGSSIERYSQVA